MLVQADTAGVTAGSARWNPVLRTSTRYAGVGLRGMLLAERTQWRDHDATDPFAPGEWPLREKTSCAPITARRSCGANPLLLPHLCKRQPSADRDYIEDRMRWV